jgi:hypothetical protein
MMNSANTGRARRIAAVSHRPASAARNGWAIAATVLCAGLAAYNIFRDQDSDVTRVAALWLSLAAILFIIHSFIASGEADRKFIASYSLYFEVSWKQGVQLALTACFVAVFWRSCGLVPSFSAHQN